MLFVVRDLSSEFCVQLSKLILGRHLEVKSAIVSAVRPLGIVVLVPHTSKIIGQAVHQPLLEVRITLINSLLRHLPVIDDGLVVQFGLDLRGQLLHL